MKQKYYSKSLAKARGYGEIYKNNTKILEFENDLSLSTKKDIINLICGQPLNTNVTSGTASENVFNSSSNKIRSINQIGLVCYRLDENHLQSSNTTTPQSVKGFTTDTPANDGTDEMNAFTGAGQALDETSATGGAKQFLHEGSLELRKFGRLINGETQDTDDRGEGFALGRPAILALDEQYHAKHDNKRGKYSSSISVGFSDVTFKYSELIDATASQDKFTFWSDLCGSGGDNAWSQILDTIQDTASSAFGGGSAGANREFQFTSGVTSSDITGKGDILIQYGAEWNVDSSGNTTPPGEPQTAKQLGCLIGDDRCILMGAYLMEFTGTDVGSGNVDGGDIVSTMNIVGSTRVFNLDVNKTSSDLSNTGAGEVLENWHDIYWTQNSIFAGKWLTEQDSPSSVTQITENDTVKGTYTIDFSPSSGKYGNPSLDNNIWVGKNMARLGTQFVPTIVNDTNVDTSDCDVNGICDWAVGLAEQYWSISADKLWVENDIIGDGIVDAKGQRVVDNFSENEWVPGDKTNKDGVNSLGSTIGLMTGHLTHVGVADSSGLLCGIKDVTAETASSDPNVTWTQDADLKDTGTYSNTCQINFGNIAKEEIKNRLYFYSAGIGSVSGNHVPALGESVGYNQSVPVGAMFPIQITRLVEGGYDEAPVESDANIPSWNDGDVLVVNFKIQWG